MTTTVKAGRLARLQMHEVSGVDHPANAPQMDGAEGWIVTKADGTPLEGETVAETETEKAGPEKDLMAANARITELEAQLKKLESKKADDAEPADEAEALAKALESMPDAVRKHFEDQRAEVLKAREEAQAASEAATVEKDARLQRVYVDKAAAFTGIAVDPATFGPVLRAVAEKAPEHAETLDTILRAVDEQLRTAGVFATVGKAGDEGPGSAYDQLVAKAKELRTADPDLSESAAITKASELHPDLVKQHRDEQKGR